MRELEPGLCECDFELLRIVEEAQAANVRTSGARRGGDVPEFLRKPAQTGAEQLIESLVAASHKAEPLAAVTVTPARRELEPSREVLDQLLGRKGPDSEDGKMQAGRSPAPPVPITEPRPTPQADRSVIDDLLADDRKPADASSEGRS